MTLHASRLGRPFLTLALMATLVACGGGGSDSAEADRETHIDTAGRLAVISDGDTAVRVVDLDSRSVVQTFALANVPSAVYASPDGRYALAFQRTQDAIQFVDGGIWQEDHGDHLHDYKEAPRLLGHSLSGVRPTHYEAHDGLAAVFMDGLETEARNAEVVTLSDASIGGGRTEARLPLPLPMHGTAEPRGEYLLATHRDAGTDSTLPTQVALYRRNGTGYTFLQRFDTPCPGLHGSFSNKDHTAFGCTDGVLVVAQDGSNFTARKIANPADIGAGVRIGTLAGHAAVTRFVGIASPGHLFDVDPVAGTITRIAWADGRTRRAHAFDAEGENFLALDDQGTLHVLDATDGWRVRAALPVIASMPAAAPFPSIAVSRAEPRAFVSDPVGRRIAAVDLAAATVAEGLALDVAPTGLAWLGLSEAHDHD